MSPKVFTLIFSLYVALSYHGVGSALTGEFISDSSFNRRGHSATFFESTRTLFLCGGVTSQSTTSSPNTMMYNTIFSYNPQTHQSTSLHNMTLPRAYGSVVTLQEKQCLYYFGGRATGSPDVPVGDFDPSVSAVVETYCSHTLDWTFSSAMPIARYLAASVVSGARLYVLGGLDPYKRTLSDVDIFNRAANMWEGSHPLPIPLHSHCAVSVSLDVVVLGGNDGTTGIPTNAVWQYQVSFRKWVSLAPMQEQRQNFGAVISEHTIYVMGGLRDAWESDFVLGLEMYDVPTNVWKAVIPAWISKDQTSWKGLAYFSVSVLPSTTNTEIYVSGGITGGGNYSQGLYVFRKNLNDSDGPKTSDGDITMTTTTAIVIASILVLLIVLGCYAQRRWHIVKGHRISQIIRPPPLNLGENFLNKSPTNSSVAREEMTFRTTLPSGPQTPKSFRDTSFNSKIGSSFPTKATIPPRSPKSPTTRSKNWIRGQLLGKGSFGSVFVGIRPDGSLIAVKVIDLQSGIGEAALESIVSEVQLMRKMPEHPHIVRYYGCHLDREACQLNIMMEYVQGGSVGQLVRRMEGPMQEEVVKRYTMQLLLGIKHLHDQNIIHRDIKGDNLLIDSGGMIKVADFGTAKRFESMQTAMGTCSVAGTPLWMAPEVLKGVGSRKTDKKYDTKADVWSVGCTVVEMLNRGKPPWPEYASLFEAVYGICSSTGLPPLIPPGLSPDCMSFLSLCFERDVDARASVEELLTHPFVSNDDEVIPEISVGEADDCKSLTINAKLLSQVMQGQQQDSDSSTHLGLPDQPQGKRRSQTLDVTIYDDFEENK